MRRLVSSDDAELCLFDRELLVSAVLFLFCDELVESLEASRRSPNEETLPESIFSDLSLRSRRCWVGDLEGEADSSSLCRERSPREPAEIFFISGRGDRLRLCFLFSFRPFFLSAFFLSFFRFRFARSSSEDDEDDEEEESELELELDELEDDSCFDLTAFLAAVLDLRWSLRSSVSPPNPASKNKTRACMYECLKNSNDREDLKIV